MQSETVHLGATNFTRTNLSSRWEDLEMLWGAKRDPLYVVLPITLAYLAIFVSGVVGNVSTCIVIARNRHMHTATNYYLFSLAVSDLLLLVAGMPPEMYHIWSNYPYVFGETFCILTGFASETSTNATLLTITAFTVERYVAICHPFFSHTLSKLSRAVKFIVLIWLLALTLAIPQVIQVGLVYAVDSDGQVISEEYKMCGLKKMVIPYSFEVSTLLFFLAPMTVIVVLYILMALRLRRSTVVNQRQRTNHQHRDSRRSTTGNPTSTKRVVKMLVAVVVAFFICWAPFHFQRLYAIYAFDGENTSSGNLKIYKVITYISGLLYYLSTTVNPFLYNIMSLKFREAFKSTLAKCVGGSKKQRSELGGSSGGAGGGGSLCPGRFNYSVLSHRSSRHNNNNNSCSSGNSYVDPDLTRRPLVVSFKRKGTRTSMTSLDYLASPERRNHGHHHHSPGGYHQELLELPKCRDSHNQLSAETVLPSILHSPYRNGRNGRISPISNSSLFSCAEQLKLSSSSYHSQELVNCITVLSEGTVAAPHPKAENVPRIEDIEIFQESQLRILKSGKRNGQEKRKQDTIAQSCSIDMDRNKSKCLGAIESTDDIKQVTKSFTLPCLMMK